MDYTIIDAHAHLWLRKIRCRWFSYPYFRERTLPVYGEIRQMVPPFMIDGVNNGGSFSVQYGLCPSLGCGITQEFIDGIQNDYLMEVVSRYPDRFFVCGMCEFRKPGYLEQAEELIREGI